MRKDIYIVIKKVYEGYHPPFDIIEAAFINEDKAIEEAVRLNARAESERIAKEICNGKEYISKELDHYTFYRVEEIEVRG